jgi:hypothetical protein
MNEKVREETISKVNPRYLTEKFINERIRKGYVGLIPMSEVQIEAMKEFDKIFKGVGNAENVPLSINSTDGLTGEEYLNIRYHTSDFQLIYALGSDAIIYLPKNVLTEKIRIVFDSTNLLSLKEDI